ncbi:MATE family efflux transporter [uncultured Devosia sp.]|uniref:MATE family efflux transporter n=1 Tax=uncultured Devosia sp. TaxID=211434 RepID=UPI0035C9AF90
MNSPSRPLWQRFLVFLVPLMAANILQSLSGTLNNIYIGQLLGVDALAAVSVFFPIMIFLISFVIGLSSGATVLIGQAWGARNVDKVKEVAGTTFTATFLLGLVVALIGIFFTGDLMQLLGAPANIVANATNYGRVLLIGMPGLFIFLMATSVLRGVGDTVTPLVSLIISLLVGLVVTPALILGWFGLPRIGIMAAAVATIAGFSSVLIFLFFYMRARKHPLAPDRVLLGYLRLNPGLFWMVLKLGVPAGVQMVVSSISAIVIVGLINRFGSDATAAYGAVNQVMSYVQFPAMSISIAASIFAAQAIGAGQIDQLRAITRTGLVMSLVITGSLVLIAYLFSERLVALFITDPAVIALTEGLLHVVLWSVVLFGLSAVFSGIMRASGTVFAPMLLSLGCIVFVELPGAIVLSQTSLGLHGIWWAYAASFSCMLVLQSAWYRFVWRKKKITALI